MPGVHADSGDGSFNPAWEHIDQARSARAEVAACWQDFCDAEGISCSVELLPNGEYLIDVLAFWPAGLRANAEDAALRFLSSILDSLNSALVATASKVSGLLEQPDPDDYKFLLHEDRQTFYQAIRDGAMPGLRPDQVRIVETFQPHVSIGRNDSTRLAPVRQAMHHLAQASHPDRPKERSLVAMWAHSAAPEVEVDPPDEVLTIRVEPDGVLEDRRTIARFSTTGDNAPVANPQIAFDLILNDPPWPTEPDDNFMARSAVLIAASSELIRALERSVGLRPPVLAATPPPAHIPPLLETSPWAPLDLSDPALAQQVANALEKSDIGLVTHQDDEGNLTMLIQTPTAVYGRPVSPALDLDPGAGRGVAAEEATLASASTWGLPDFIFGPLSVNKAAGRREIGDGTVMTGSKALAVQVKAREAVSSNPDRERAWLLKKATEGARQAKGTIRTLCAAPAELVNGRGRGVRCDGTTLTWASVVILDHDDPPPDVQPDFEDLGIPIIALLRRDWDFLFDQLRSVSAVVDYVHRVAEEGSRPLGEEPIRYYELADADERSTDRDAEPWVREFGGSPLSHPILPKIPASSADGEGHAVFRVILEDIAESPFEGSEEDRLYVLSLIDRFSVGGRADLGRLLLSHLEEAISTRPETTLWRTRRVLQDSARLHLAFTVCNSLTELHREAFQQWTFLRHQELLEAGITPSGEHPWTVSVLLTPRYDGYRPWDTTVLVLQESPGFSPQELDQIRAFWDRSPSPDSTQ